MNIPTISLSSCFSTNVRPVHLLKVLADVVEHCPVAAVDEEGLVVGDGDGAGVAHRLQVRGEENA